MKVVLAFDSFKGCMTAAEACHAAALAIQKAASEKSCRVETVECPLSDGGEGLVDCVEQLSQGSDISMQRIRFEAHDPLMQSFDASYIIVGNGKDASHSASVSTAYMEMAATGGLPLVPMGRRNPELTTTYGVGDMIADAALKGCDEIVMGIGGSATCDGGKGMIQSLIDHGLFDRATRQPSPNACPLPPITVASDVTNPLFGRQGAAYIFAPQKGATPEQVVRLDNMLQSFARETEHLGLASPELADHPGAGAAGGLGYGLMAYLHAELKSGIDIILDLRDFNRLIADADLVITGEGKSDEQTLMGKVPHGVLRRCQKEGIPVWLLSGSIDDSNSLLSKSFTLVKSINEGDSRPLDELMQPEVAQANLLNTIVKAFHKVSNL